jgi:hypothetical protein
VELAMTRDTGKDVIRQREFAVIDGASNSDVILITAGCIFIVRWPLQYDKILVIQRALRDVATNGQEARPMIEDVWNIVERGAVEIRKVGRRRFREPCRTARSC